MRLEKTAAALLTALALTACGGGSAESITSSAAPPAESPVTEAESTAETPPESIPEVPEVTDSRETDGIAFAGKVLVDEAGIRITAREFVREDFADDGIRLLIENETPKTCLIECPLLAVNGYQLGGNFSAEVAGGKKLNTVLELPGTALKMAEITELHSVSAAFAAYERDEWRKMLATKETVIFDDGTEAVPPKDPGTEIFNKEGVRAFARMVRNDAYWGTGIVLYFVNEGKNKVYAEAKNLSVDGYMLDGYWGTMLYPGKRAVGKIYLLESDFEENDIKDPKEAELAVGLCDPDTMEDIVSGTGSFSAG